MSEIEKTVLIRLRGEAKELKAAAAEAKKELKALEKQAQVIGDAMKTASLVGVASLASVVSAVGDLSGSALTGMFNLAKTGAMSVFGAIKDGVTNINPEIEGLTLGFATLFRMFKQTDSFESGLSRSRDLIRDLKKDAAALPGSFQEFAGMAKTMTVSMAKMGLGPEYIRSTTRDMLLTSKALGMETQHAAREFNQLMEGKAGGQNTLGTRLGITKESNIKVDQTKGKDGELTGGKEVKFNKATTEQRYSYLMDVLGQTGKESLFHFERSWEGVTSTLKDKWTDFKQMATAPLFGAAERGLWRLKGWIEKNEDKINDFAETISIKLFNAWMWFENQVSTFPEWIDQNKDKFFSFAHDFVEGAKNAYTHFKKLIPVLEKISEVMIRAFESPQATIKLLAGLKIAGVAAGAVPGVASTAFNMAALSKMASIQKVAKAAATGGGTATAATAAAGATAETAAVGGTTAASGGLAAALGPIAVVAAGIASAVFAVKDNVLGVADYLKPIWDGIKTFADDVVFSIGWMVDFVKPILGAFGAAVAFNLGTAVQIVMVPLELLAALLKLLFIGVDVLWGKLKDWYETSTLINAILSTLNDTWTTFKTKVEAAIPTWVIEGLDKFSSGITRIGDSIKSALGLSDLKPIDYGAVVDRTTTATMMVSQKNYAEKPTFKPEQPPKIDARGSKIEIKIDAKNEDPDRIVRRMFDSIGKAVSRPNAAATQPVSSF